MGSPRYAQTREEGRGWRRLPEAFQQLVHEASQPDQGSQHAGAVHPVAAADEGLFARLRFEVCRGRGNTIQKAARGCHEVHVRKSVTKPDGSVVDKVAIRYRRTDRKAAAWLKRNGYDV
jgi:hypothetical protein